MKTYIRLVTRKELFKVWPDIGDELHWWNRLFLHVRYEDHNFYCPFTPWRLIATLFVRKSVWYKRRVNPFEES